MGPEESQEGDSHTLESSAQEWGRGSRLVSKCYSRVLSVSLLAVWNRIIEPVAAMRKEADMLRLFPEYLKGEELFGLTVHAVLRIAESVSKR